VPRILLVNPNFEDYLTDSLMHGLRSVLGEDLVDYPKADHMYSSYPAERRARLYGRGFTLAGGLDDIEIDRNKVLYRAADGEFDLVVFSDIWRNFGLWTQWFKDLRGQRLAVVDGADRIEPYPYSGLWWRVRPWWFLPRIGRRALHFKREVTPWTGWFRSYLTLPPPLSRPFLRSYRPLAFSIPASKVVDATPPKEKEFPAHIVDPEVARRVGGQETYAFDDEESYYDDLRRSRFGITTKRAGWDCMRHYEIAASGAVPCFRALDRKPDTAAPYGLDASNCLIYRDAEHLLAQVAALDGEHYAQLQAGSLAWVRRNTTVARAREFLAACGLEAS
jgi:hypothetical protein